MKTALTICYCNLRSTLVFELVPKCTVNKAQPIMLNFLPIMLLNNAQKFAYYAQYYMPMTTANMLSFVYDFITFND